MKAKIAGGAQMFAGGGNSSLASIGQRCGSRESGAGAPAIPIIAEDTGKIMAAHFIWMQEMAVC